MVIFFIIFVNKQTNVGNSKKDIAGILDKT